MPTIEEQLSDLILGVDELTAAVNIRSVELQNVLSLSQTAANTANQLLTVTVPQILAISNTTIEVSQDAAEFAQQAFIASASAQGFATAAANSATQAALSAASINPNNIDINGGTIDGTLIGSIVPAAGTFTTLSANTITVTGQINGRTFITSTDTILTNTNNTTIPTSAAVDAHIPVRLNASGNAPIYAARAWVNFNGTGTVAIRGSGNVSSVTDNGNGNYTVNFTLALPDANYSVSATAGDNSLSSLVAHVSDLTTSSFRIYVKNHSTDALTDATWVNVVVFR